MLEARFRPAVPARVLLVFTTIALLASTDLWAQRPALVPVPTPSLEGVEAAVRERLTTSRDTLDAALADPETDPEALAVAFGTMGRVYLAVSLNAPAEACLQNAARLAPDDPRWPHTLGALYHADRRIDEARAQLERTITLLPDNVATLLRLGDTLAVAGERAQARTRFEQALAEDPTAAYAHFGLGKLATEDERWAEAVQHYEAALRHQPTATAIHQPLGIAYRELGDRDKARSHLGATGNVAVSFSDPLLNALAPNTLGAYLWSAVMAAQRGDNAQAIALYRKAIEADPDVASTYMSLGSVLLADGQREEGVAAFETAHRLSPEDPVIRLRLGQVLSTDDESVGRAVDHLAAASAALPGHRDGLVDLGKALARTGRHEEALVPFDTALTMDPFDREARNYRARARSQVGDDTGAADDLQQLVTADPTNRQARLDLAAVLTRQGDFAGAESHLTEALTLELRPQARIMTLFNLAALRQQVGDDAGAIGRYREVLALAPDLPDAHFNVGVALARRGRFDEAAGHFAEVTRLTPGNEPGWVALARAWASAGQREKAVAALDRGLAEGPAAGLSDAAAERLRQLAANLRQGS